MSFAHGLYVRFRHLIHEAAKFGVIGGIAFVVTEVGTNVLHFDIGIGPLSANVVATALATVVSYLGNRYWTFRHREGSGLGREYVTFFLLNGVGLVIQLACIGFTYYVIDLTGRLAVNVALVVGIGLGTLFRFWSYRRWVWRAPVTEVLEGHESLEPATAGRPEPQRAPGQHRR